MVTNWSNNQATSFLGLNKERGKLYVLGFFRFKPDFGLAIIRFKAKGTAKFKLTINVNKLKRTPPARAVTYKYLEVLGPATRFIVPIPSVTTVNGRAANDIFSFILDSKTYENTRAGP